MNAVTSSRFLQWWAYGVGAVERARPVLAGYTAHAIAPDASAGGLAAVLATRILRSAQGALLARSKARSSESIAAAASRHEQYLPNLAAELRVIALRQPEAVSADHA